MHTTAELIGAAGTLVGLGILTLVSVQAASAAAEDAAEARAHRARGCRRRTGRV